MPYNLYSNIKLTLTLTKEKTQARKPRDCLILFSLPVLKTVLYINLIAIFFVFFKYYPLKYSGDKLFKNRNVLTRQTLSNAIRGWDKKKKKLHLKLVDKTWPYTKLSFTLPPRSSTLHTQSLQTRKHSENPCKQRNHITCLRNITLHQNASKF